MGLRSRKLARVFGTIDGPLGLKLYPKKSKFLSLLCGLMPLLKNNLRNYMRVREDTVMDVFESIGGVG